MENNATKRFIEVAIQGGWKIHTFPIENYKYINWYSVYEFRTERAIFHLQIEKILFDPKAWQAAGQVLGWGEKHNCGACGSAESLMKGVTCFPESYYKQLQLVKLISEASLKPNFDMSSEIEVYLSTLFKE